MKKVLVMLLILVTATSFVFTQGNQETSSAPYRLSISAGNTTGAFYIICTGLSNVINNSGSNIETTVEVSGGSIENALLMQQGEVAMAIMGTDVAFQAVDGTINFAGNPYEGFRQIGQWHNSVVTIFATKASGITNMSQMKGKKIAVGTPGGTQRQYFENLLKVYGMSYADIITYDYNYSEAIDAAKDSLIDVVVVQGGIPNSNMLDLVSTTATTCIEIDDWAIKKMCELYPYFSPFTMSASVYNTGTDIRTLSVTNTIALDKSVPDDVAYNITKAIYTNLDYLATVHSACAEVTHDSAVSGYGTSIQFHPGALKFWKEMGKIK